MKIGDVHGPSYSRCRRLRPISGSGGRTRTATGFTPTDFESVVSTNFTTPPSESGRDYTEPEPESNQPAGKNHPPAQWIRVDQTRKAGKPVRKTAERPATQSSGS